MRESIYSRVLAVRAVDTTTIDGEGDTDGASVGLNQGGADFRVACVVLMAHDVTDGTYTATVQESADGATGWTDVPAARLEGAASVSAANEVAQVGVVPDPAASPFLRARVTASDITTGGTVSAVLLLGSPSALPVTH
jgi:hypothetical protein